MSITFLVAGGPTEQREAFGEPFTVQALGEVNLGNCKAAGVLRLIDRGDEQEGCLEGEALDQAIEAATRALNTPVKVQSQSIAPQFVQGGMRVRQIDGLTRIERGASIHEMGVSVQALQDGLTAVLAVMVAARREGFPFCWG